MSLISKVIHLKSFIARPSKVYLSTNGGKSFEDISDRIDNEMVRRKSGVLSTPADLSRVILIVNNHPMGYADTSEIYVTLDKGVFHQFHIRLVMNYLPAFSNVCFV